MLGRERAGGKTPRGGQEATSLPSLFLDAKTPFGAKSPTRKANQTRGAAAARGEHGGLGRSDKRIPHNSIKGDGDW